MSPVEANACGWLPTALASTTETRVGEDVLGALLRALERTDAARRKMEHAQAGNGGDRSGDHARRAVLLDDSDAIGRVTVAGGRSATVVVPNPVAGTNLTLQFCTEGGDIQAAVHSAARDVLWPPASCCAEGHAEVLQLCNCAAGDIEVTFENISWFSAERAVYFRCRLTES